MEELLAQLDVSSVATLAAAIKHNPDLDVVHDDLLSPEAVASLELGSVDADETLHLLRAYQRVLRVHPDVEAATVLIDTGFDSAHAIAAAGRARFVAGVADKLGPDGARTAEGIFRAARVTQNRADHLAANVYSVAGSRLHRAMAVNHVGDDITEHFQSLSSYQEIFGSLDYCSCAECRSVLGPPAYLVDLLRIIDIAVTVPNTSRPTPDAYASAEAAYESGGLAALTDEEKRVLLDLNIPPGLRLFDRRPDLGEMLLTCANTSDEVPYLELVNDIVAQTVARGLRERGALDDDDLWLTLANTFFPFDLPFELPLEQTRAYLAARHVELSSVFDALAPDPSTSIAVGREALKMSVTQLANIEPQAPARLPPVLSKNYGLTITSGDLAGLDEVDVFRTQTGMSINDLSDLFRQNLGPKELFDVSGEYTPSGWGTTMKLAMVGDRVSGTYDYKGGTLAGTLRGSVVRGEWAEDGGKRGDFAFTFSPDASSFTGKWSETPAGGWDPLPWDGTRNAGTPSTAGIIPHALFINKVLDAGQWLHVVPGQDGDTIAYQSIETLDTINRFLRLSRRLGWTPAELDWALTSLHAPSVSGSTLTNVTKLDAATIIELAKLRSLTVEHGLSHDFATSLWFDLRTTGIGNGEISQAPFDQIFNSPAVLQQFSGDSIYHPKIEVGPTSYVNPLYTQGAIPWEITVPDPPVAGEPETSSFRSRADIIVSSIPTDTDDIRTIATAAFHPQTTVDLTVPHLSLLYRHSLLAKQLEWRADGYLRALELLGFRAKGFPDTLDRDQALSLFQTASWVGDSGLTIYDVDYACTGTTSPYVQIGYDPDAIPGLLPTVSTSLQSTLATPDLFTSQGIDAASSAAYVEVLIDQGLIDPSGIVVGDPHDLDLTRVGDYAPDVAAPTAAQLKYVEDKLRTQAADQAQHVSAQLASFFGVSSKTMNTLMVGAAIWLRLDSVAAPYVVESLFSAKAADLLEGVVLDVDKVIKAFTAHGIKLSNRTTVEPSVVTTWTVKDGGTGGGTYTATTHDLAVVEIFELGGSGAAKLFSVDWTAVSANGNLDAAKLAQAFTDHGHRPKGTLEVTPLVEPHAWMVVDPTSSASYPAIRSHDGKTVDFQGYVGAAASAGMVPSSVVVLFDQMSRMLVIDNALSASSDALATVVSNPVPFGIDDDAGVPISFNLRGVESVFQFAALEEAFNDQKGRLAEYFAAITSKKPHDYNAMLASIAGWDAAQCEALCHQIFGVGHCSTVAGVVRLKHAFEMADQLGSDAYYLLALNDKRNTAPDDSSWTALQDLASQTLQLVRAKTTATAWPTVFGQLSGPIEDAKRDALVPIAIWILGQTWSDITTPRSLYEYLLIDVEMSGCALISPLKEALNAAQLYLQRCRLNLERNVAISTNDLPTVWWEWLMNYRIWEANREIFLYPESYIDPTLRRSKTSLFSDLQNTLLQGQLTPEKVESAFRTYLDALAQIANLDVVDAYYARLEGTGAQPTDTLFVFSRTDAQPYKFYLAERTRVANCDDESAWQWTEWLPIGITINSSLVTPVYAFNKLILFWVELTQKQERDASSTPRKYAITTAAVRYSHRDFQGNWMQPQTLVDDLVINVEAADSLYGPFAKSFANMEDLFWEKVTVLHVPASAYADPGENTEKIVVTYGSFINHQSGTAAKPPDPNAYKGMPDVVEFTQTMVETDFVKKQLAGMKQAGMTPIQDGVVLDQYLEPSSLQFDNQYVLLGFNALDDESPPYFRVALNGSTLALQAVGNTLYENYVAGANLPAPLILEAGASINEYAFANDYVDEGTSKSIYTTLSQPTVKIIVANKVTDAAVTTSYTMLKTLLGMSDAVVRHTREVLFEYYYGTPLLFSAIANRGPGLTPVKNLPSSFILTSGGETFLFDASTAGRSSFTMVDRATTLSKPQSAVTPDVFTSYNIDADRSREYFAILSKAPNNVIDPDGVVDTPAVSRIAPQMLATLLSTDVGRAQEVKSTLLSGFGPALLEYTPDGFVPEDTLFSLRFSTTRLSTAAIHHLSDALYNGGIPALLDLSSQQAPVNITLPFSRFDPTPATVPPDGTNVPPRLAPPPAPYGRQVDFSGPYGLYYWELFFHAPFLVAKMLHDNQQFQDAESWLQYVFNPTLPIDPLTEKRFVADRPDDVSEAEAKSFYAILTTPPNVLIDTDGNVTAAAKKVSVSMLATLLSTSETIAGEIKNLLTNNYLLSPTGRYWRFEPFRTATLQSLRERLTDCAQIAAYNNDPFDPDAIARLRIGAYEKAVVIYYIQNLLDWGDFEFSQYSWESITTARMLYIYAYDLLGPIPEDLGECADEFPVSFNDILARYDDDPSKIPQFLIDMENALSGPNPPGLEVGDAVQPYNDLGGYFCVPENTNLSQLWATVEDRLYKIRHCLNIDGQPQPLPLFQPPISPADLIRAGAAGASVLASQHQLPPLIPNYRFDEMLRRAVAATQTVTGFGQQLLSALEKNDAEGLALLRSNHEVTVLEMITAVKRSAVEDQQKQLAGLQQSLASAKYRVTYYGDLISTGLNAAEIANHVLMGAAILYKGGAIPFHGLSIAGYLAPNIFGLSDGGMKFGDAINAGAQIANTVSEMLGQSAQIAQIAGEQERRAQTWQDQKTLANYDVQTLTQQIAGAEARIAQAEQDLETNLQQITNAQSELQYLKTKFTNQELYQWMVGRVSAVYFQAYRVAHDLAMAAQTAYQFELDRDDTFVSYGYWDDLRQGLLAGEGMLLALRQMESAYLTNNDRRLEIVKTISVRDAFPEAFFGFKWGYRAGTDASSKGRLDFTLSEKLFDLDFPGHYLRKISSVSVSIPAVIGPYQDLHATLTQRTNMVLEKPDADAVDYLIWRTSPSHGGQPPPAPAAGTVRENWVPNQQIAVSRGVDDSGLFVLDFRDPRYLPFEGTGAVSSWTFAMPPETNPIDFNGISDVIVKVRYTACDGGTGFASQVERLYGQSQPVYQDTRTTAFTLAQAFSSEWFSLFDTAPVGGKQTIALPIPKGATLPNVVDPTLVGVLVQLELADGSSVSDGSGTFLTLQIDDKPTTPVDIPIQNNFGELDDSAVSAFGREFTDVTWSLAFDVAKAPSALLTNGALDASKLADFALIIVYKSPPFR